MSKSKKIIILEDDRILLKALNIELISNGFEVLSATDGVAGIKIIEKEKPDLILLDLVMPKMHG
ncbi:response regulator, partial [Candidatus Parcubacteria bacterium]|nr:response regulator [Candidatus Parcubacteria bacterium]